MIVELTMDLKHSLDLKHSRLLKFHEILEAPILDSKNETEFFFASPGGICLLKVNNRNTRTKSEICSKLTTKTPERRQETPEQGVKYV